MLKTHVKNNIKLYLFFNILFNVISLKNPSVAKITVKNINIPHKIQLIKIKL